MLPVILHRCHTVVDKNGSPSCTATTLTSELKVLYKEGCGILTSTAYIRSTKRAVVCHDTNNKEHFGQLHCK